MLSLLKKLVTPEKADLMANKSTETTQRSETPRTIPIPDKDQLFAWWATDNFGDQDGKLLYQGLLEVNRIVRAIHTHGDFVTARQSLLRIATLFPNAGDLPSTPAEGTPDTRSQIRWRELMAVQYAKPAP